MKEDKHSDNLQVEGGNMETKVFDASGNAYDVRDIVEAICNGELDDWDDDIDDLFDDGDDYISPEEAKALDQLLKEAFMAEVEHYTKEGMQMEPSGFSEEYEANMRATLEKYLGKEKADQVMYERAVRDGKVTADANTMAVADAGKDKELNFVSIILEHSSPQLSLLERAGQWWRRLKYKAAVVWLGVVVVCGIAVMSVDALKTPIARFLFKTEPEYVVLNPEPETLDDAKSPDTIETKYVPGKVLDGYEEVNRIDVSKSVVIAYENKEGLKYQFEQKTKDIHTWIDIENAETEKYNTVFGDAFYYEKEGIHKLVWHYEGYIFKLEGNLTEEEMIDLANSLRLE